MVRNTEISCAALIQIDTVADICTTSSLRHRSKMLFAQQESQQELRESSGEVLSDKKASQKKDEISENYLHIFTTGEAIYPSKRYNKPSSFHL